MPAGVHDAQRLWLGIHAPGKLLVGQLARVLHLDALVESIKSPGIRRQLHHVRAGRQKALHYRLRCGAEDSRCAIISRQLVYGQQAWPDVVARQHLGLIENEDRFGQIVQLATPGRAIGIERLEELNVCGDDDGDIPVLGRQPQFPQNAVRLFICLSGVARPVERLPVEIGVMLQHIVQAQHALELRGILLDDAGIGNDVDDTFQAMRYRMVQGESQRREGLSAAGWNRKGE